ncbi:hypothetical protein DSJ_01465 [Pantoea stewartii subsp. stewartii DC283]|uniref:Uncharacterized protein n=1 Tax=Pantoea stewartii subsp. stewartii DC283 TaxID=660596 RepID=A0ABM6K1D9_PANSE|nr:hypothetical protein DSJ_01465 [Pantoea stewartii subsp. stewartii DC283]
MREMPAIILICRYNRANLIIFSFNRGHTLFYVELSPQLSFMVFVLSYAFSISLFIKHLTPKTHCILFQCFLTFA